MTPRDDAWQAAGEIAVGEGRRMRLWGAGSGAPLLLLHGFPLDHRMWDGQRALVEPGGALFGRFRLLAPDLPGFGASPAPAATSIAAMADDAAALVAAAAGGRAVVCGLSMGGYVAQHLAARHRALVRGLVLVDTRLEADAPEARAARADLAARVERLGAGVAAEAMLPRLVSRERNAALDAPPAPRRAAVEAALRAAIASTSTDTIRRALLALAERPDMAAAASSFDVPTLLVVGADDAITPPECLERAAAVITGARLSVVPGCGHLTPLEDPPAFNAALAAFLEALPHPDAG